MTKLIVEEGGQRREFNVGDGRLTVGSGAAAHLKLISADVAQIHLELEVEGAGARVIPRPGVLPPSIAAVPLRGEADLAPGQVLQIGSARLWLHEEASGLGPVGGISSGKQPRPKTAPRSRSVVQRRRKVERGLPTGLIIAAVLIVVGTAVAFTANVLRKQGELGAGPVWAAIQAAELELEVGNLDRAEFKLNGIPAVREVTPEEETRISELRLQIVQRRRDSEFAVENLRGYKYLDVLLKKYETRWLSGAPEPHTVRLFLKRCAEFRRRWPGHPEMDWVDRQESRFRGFVDLGATPTWDDVQWEIKYLAGTKPRDYRQAFGLLQDFMNRAAGEELIAADELRQQLVEERVEYHQDRLYQAQYEYERKDNPSKAVWWLLHSVIWIGDEEMADEAAEFLVKIPGLETHLLGYRQTYPERYHAVLRHPLVRSFARESGLPE